MDLFRYYNRVKIQSENWERFKKFEGEFAEEFQGFVTNLNMKAACSQSTGELQELMAAWGAPVFEKVAGFVRY